MSAASKIDTQRNNDMKKINTLLLFVLSMSVASAQDTLTPAQMIVDHRQYNLNLHIEGDTLRVSGFYLIP